MAPAPRPGATEVRRAHLGRSRRPTAIALAAAISAALSTAWAGSVATADGTSSPAAHGTSAATAATPFDLALRTSFVDAEHPVQPGSLLTWHVEVINQGDAAVREIDIRDYPIRTIDRSVEDPPLELAALVDPLIVSAPADFVVNVDDASPTGDPAGRVLSVVGSTATDVLDPGESIVVQFSTVVAASWLGQDFVNWAEISRFDDDADRTNGDSNPANPDTPPSGPLRDRDSTPDQDPVNDNAPSVRGDPDDDAIDGNGLAGGDEDDHDVAVADVFDLALIIERSNDQLFEIEMRTDGRPTPVRFDITVKNQGNHAAAGIEVAATFPTGLRYDDGIENRFNAALARDVDFRGGGDFVIGELGPGASTTFTMAATVTDASLAEYIVAAEIASFASAEAGAPAAAVDIDSVADRVDDESPATGTFALDPANADDPRNGTNDIDADRTPAGVPIPGSVTGDEDDHDREVVVLPFDLAIQKRLADTPDVRVDGLLAFELLLSNQGRTVRDVELTDHLRQNYRYDPADNVVNVTSPRVGSSQLDITYDSNAAPANGSTIVRLAGELAGGDVVAIPINVRVAEVAEQMDNVVEISRFDDDGDPSTGDSDPSNPDNPVSGPLRDRDSTPDGIDGNGPGENRPGEALGGALIDNEIEQDGRNGGDEDDHDLGGIPFFDASLILERSAGQPLVIDVTQPTTTADFDITVSNQGFSTLEDIVVVNYLPPGVGFVELLAPNVEGSAQVGVLVDASSQPEFRVDELAGGGLGVQGESVTFTVRAEVDLTMASIGSRLENEAEIAQMLGRFDADGDGVLELTDVADVDSFPDRKKGNDWIVTANVVGGDPFDGPNDPAVDAARDGVNGFDLDPRPEFLGDEDDADLEMLIVPVDLAVSTRPDGPDLVDAPDDGLISFVVEVSNEGFAPLTSLRLRTTFDPALTLDAAVNPPGTTGPSSGSEWLRNGIAQGTFTSPSRALDFRWIGDGQVEMRGELAPGESATVPVTFRVDESVLAPGARLTRLAHQVELVGLDGDDDAATPTPIDVDSEPANGAVGEDDLATATIAVQAPPAPTTTTTTTTIATTTTVAATLPTTTAPATNPPVGSSSTTTPATTTATTTTVTGGIGPDLVATVHTFDLDLFDRTITWELGARNDGDAAAPGPIGVVVELGPGLTLVTAPNALTIGCTGPDQQIECVLAAELAAGEAATTTIVTRVADGFDEARLRVSVSGDEPGDPTPNDNVVDLSVSFMGDLPETGGGSEPLAWVAALLSVLGWALVLAGRRRRTVA